MLVFQKKLEEPGAAEGLAAVSVRNLRMENMGAHLGEVQGWRHQNPNFFNGTASRTRGSGFPILRGNRTSWAWVAAQKPSLPSLGLELWPVKGVVRGMTCYHTVKGMRSGCRLLPWYPFWLLNNVEKEPTS